VTETERQAAIEAIKQLKARYFRCMDTKDWDGLRTIFAPDAVYDATDAVRNGSGDDTLHQKLGPEWINRGGDNIADFIQRAVQDVSTVHHGHMPEIEIVSPTQARGVWAMEDANRKYENGRLVRSLHGFGHYWETYEKIDGRWFIKTSRLTRLRVDVQEFGDTA